MCIYSHMFKLQSLQSTPYLIQYTDQDVIPTAQGSLWTNWFWCILVLLLFYVSPLSHQKRNISLSGLFSAQETKKETVAGGEIWWIGRMGHGDHPFWVKNCWTHSIVWAGVLVNHPSQNRQRHWNSVRWHSKNVTEAAPRLPQQCQLVHWHRRVPRTLP